jgi:GPH family glycoside/pentoside/hexuronide:cation symporter
MSTIKTRVLYGTGGAVYAVKESAYTMFILLFYTQVLGLNGVTTGFIIGISLLWDAISDPLVGVLSDRLESRFGRRHPFMVASAIPAGLGFIGLFSPPAAILQNEILLASWLLFWSLWVRTFITGFAIPHMALSAEISRQYNERSQILGARLAFLFLFAVFVPALALSVIFNQQDGVDARFVAASYPLYGALSCAVVWIMASISIIGTRRFIKPSKDTSSTTPTALSMRSLVVSLGSTMKNRTFRLIMGYDLMASISYGTVVTLNMLAWTYFWEFSAAQISIILAVPSIIAIALAMTTLGPLSRRFQKYQLLQFALIGVIADMLWLYPLRLFDMLPENGSNTVFWLNFLFMLIFIYCFLLRSISSSSIVADVTDEHELEHGVRQEATFFAAINFLSKVATVFGPVYSGIVLEVIGLKEGLLPGEVPQSTLDNLIYAMGIGAVPALCIGLIFVTKISMTRAQVEDIQTALDARRTGVE